MPEVNSTTENNPEAEIKELSRLLEEKKKALEAQGETKEHKEIFQEVFSEKYKEAIPPPSMGAAVLPTPSLHASPSDDPKHKAVHEQQIQELVQDALANGLLSAVLRASRETPWLLDELHDRLADEYYQKLVQAKEIKML